MGQGRGYGYCLVGNIGPKKINANSSQCNHLRLKLRQLRTNTHLKTEKKEMGNFENEKVSKVLRGLRICGNSRKDTKKTKLECHVRIVDNQTSCTAGRQGVKGPLRFIWLC